MTGASTPLLFQPLQLRSVTVRNRIWVSPMCMYSCWNRDGVPHDFHLVHLGARALGGAGLVFTEATAVSPEGRISPEDAGIWSDAQAAAWTRIAHFIKAQGATAAMQLAHAGRKASTASEWNGDGPLAPGGPEGGWRAVGPSAVPFDEGFLAPQELDAAGIQKVRSDFVAAASRALAAGFEVLELHCAHGYLLHSFLSPLANKRTDEYGGSLENRMRLPLEVAADVRAALPEGVPLIVRISATDWVGGGWDVEQSVEFARRLRETVGVDLVDCSSGGAVRRAAIPVGLGYQVPLSDAVRRGAAVATGAVGLIVGAKQAEQILQEGSADVVLLAREFLRDPNFPLQAAAELGYDATWPVQYARAKRRKH